MALLRSHFTETMSRHVRPVYFWSLNKYASAFQFYSNLILIEVGLQTATVPELPAPAFASTPQPTNDDQADRESGGCPWASKSRKALVTGRDELPTTPSLCRGQALPF